MSKLVKGAEYKSSYREEHTTMETVANMIVEQNLQGPILICTDSQSLCKALAERNKQTNTIRKKLSECDQAITIQWIPGHSNIPGNELADQAAKEATMLNEDNRPTSFGSACAAIKQQIKEENLSGHERTAKAYAHFSKLKEKKIKTARNR